MKPTIGRTVRYRSQDGGDFAAIIVATPDCAAREPAPDNGHVRLNVFWDGARGDYFTDGGVPGPADQPGHWRWPERDA